MGVDSGVYDFVAENGVNTGPHGEELPVGKGNQPPIDYYAEFTGI